MALFRILHMSDFHVRHRKFKPTRKDREHAEYAWGKGKGAAQSFLNQRGVVDSAYRLQEYIQDLFKMPNLLDLFLVTGDLAHTGDDEDLQEAADLLGKFLSNTPNAGTKRIFVPGNHDRFNGPLRLPGGNRFSSFFQAEWTGVENGVSAWSLPKYCTSTQQTEVLAVISADFSLKTMDDSAKPPFWYMGQGRAYKDIVDGLKKKTAKLRQDHEENGIFIIWAFHFPPNFPYGNYRLDNFTGAMELLDAHLVEKAADDCEVSLILGGHSHTKHAYPLDKANISKGQVFCASTTLGRPVNDSQGFHVVDLEIRQGKLHCAVKRQDFCISATKKTVGPCLHQS